MTPYDTCLYVFITQQCFIAGIKCYQAKKNANYFAVKLQSQSYWPFDPGLRSPFTASRLITFKFQSERTCVKESSVYGAIMDESHGLSMQHLHGNLS